MENSSTNPEITEPVEEKSFFGIIIHSFFVIPFLIALAAVLLFATMHWLTREQLTAKDYLEQVKIGGMNKRWQAAFELSKILANPKLIPTNSAFTSEMEAAFLKAQNDDPRVRQYLALAMARMNNPAFLKTLVSGLKDSNEENQYAVIYALGMLKDRRGIPVLLEYLDHSNPRIRSITVVAIGNIGDDNIRPALRRMLNDQEPNVQWGAAISLAKFKDPAGKAVLENLLNRDYLSKYSEVDPSEQTQIVLGAVSASSMLNDADLNTQLKKISTTDQSMKVRQAALEAISKL